MRRRPAWTLVTIRDGVGVVARTVVIYEACDRPSVTGVAYLPGRPPLWLRVLGEGESP